MIKKISKLCPAFSGKKSKGGFTLVEMMVSIAIIAIAIAGPLVIASQVAGYSNLVNDQTTAYFLAQDAIEYSNERARRRRA